MRYITYMIVFLILSLAILSYGLMSMSKKPSGNWVIKVNDRAITKEEFEKAFKRYASIHGEIDKKAFIEETITKELLIQEAKKRGLDTEDPFVYSMQNYYEQTLIKNLLQSVMSEIKFTDEERKQEEMEKWLKELRDKASIKIRDDIKQEAQ